MKFLVDAQLPQKLADYLNKKGLDSLHTLQLPDRNRSTDEFICQMADSEQRC